jgi:hypothetical protein
VRGYGAEDSGSLVQPLHVSTRYANSMTMAHADSCSTKRNAALGVSVLVGYIAPTIPGCEYSDGNV